VRSCGPTEADGARLQMMEGDMFDDILRRVYFENTVSDYLVCLAVIAGGLIVIWIFKLILLKRLKALVKSTDRSIDDFIVALVDKKLMPILYFGVFYVGIRRLALDETLARAITIIGLAFVMIFIVRILLAVADYSLYNYWVKRGEEESRRKAVGGIIAVLRVIVWIGAFVIFLDNLGIEVSALITGLGIGGIAVALAAQAILTDLFSYFTIFFDRPFEIGDFIIVGEFKGTVEHIGIKTSRLRSLSGEELIFSNTDLTNSRVRNYKRMERRRVLFNIGVTYQTSVEQLKQIPALIEEAIGGFEDVVFDRAHFSSFGDFNLDLEVVYYVVGRDYNKYMDIQQGINLKIKEEFEKRGIEFAYPTQTLFLEKE